MAVSPTDELEDNTVADQRDAIDASQQDGTLDDNSADSSTAEDADKPSLLDAVSAALHREEEQPSGSKGDDEGAEDAAKAAAGDESKDEKTAEAKDADLELSEEETKGTDPKARRIRNLVGKVKEAHDQVRTLTPVAERMARIDKFVEENGLSKENMNTLFEGAVKLKKGGLTDEDFRTGVEMMVAVNNDPQRAFELLMPLMETLAALTGEVLSPELAEQVTAGQITEEAAREISRARAGRVIQTTQQTEAQKRAQAEQQQSAQAQLQKQGDAVATGITQWENQWKRSDPDYAIKSSLWRDKMDAYIAKVTLKQEPIPADAKAIVAIAEKLKKEVETTLMKIRPSKKPINPTPHGVGTSTGSKAAPFSLKEAIGQALNQ